MVTLIISFDGREACIENPSEKLCDEAIGAATHKGLARLFVEIGTNCDRIQVFPGKHAGIIKRMYISGASISAVRFASPTSSESK